MSKKSVKKPDYANTTATVKQKNGSISAVVLKYNDYEITFVKQ